MHAEDGKIRAWTWSESSSPETLRNAIATIESGESITAPQLNRSWETIRIFPVLLVEIILTTGESLPMFRDVRTRQPATPIRNLTLTIEGPSF